MIKHILLCTDDPGVGGAAQCNHSLLCGLVKLGYQVTCVQSKASNSLITHQQLLGIHHIWLEGEAVDFFMKTFKNLSLQPDIIIFSNSCPFSNWIPKETAIELGIPYIIIEHLVDPHLATQFAAYLNQLLHQYTLAKSVIAVSHDSLNLLHKWFKLPKYQGQVIYNGRPPQYFAPRNAGVRERLRQEWSIPLDAIVCFTAARIETRKGYQYQLEAIKQLIPSPIWSKLYFAWAGGGIFDPQLETQLKESVQELKITEKVKFLGQIPDVSEWLDVADMFVFPSELEGMPLCVMEAMAKGLPVIATDVSGISEELGNNGKLLSDPKIDSQATIKELVTTIEEWVENPELRHSIGQDCKQRAEEMFREERMIEETVKVIERALLPVGDYVSPGFELVQPDKCFPNMIAGDANSQPWPYLRREIPHNWYVDKRHPTIGFLSRDEAHILYNTALKFQGKKALEIGCWLGWSACHLALAGVQLDVVDPLLAIPEFYESVSNSLKAAEVFESVNLVDGYSPQKVEELADQFQRKWSLIFIDGNHESPGPLNDAIACEQLAEADALILFHDLASPDVAQGLDYLRDKGWQTLVYQTMQIMGVAWRGNVEPVIHQPDPKVNWVLPAHLQSYTVSGISNNQSVDPFLNKLFHYVEEYHSVSDVRSSVDFSGARQKFTELIQKGKECFVKGEIETAITTFTQALKVHPSSLIAQNYLSSLYWQVGDVQKSLQHHILAQFSNIPFDNTLTDEFQEILSVIRPYTLLSEARLFSLYSLARQICLDNIPGNFVECGSYKGGSAALLAVVIKRYSLRPRVVYAFDTFEGMPEPTEADKHNGIPANLTDWGAGTLKAPLTDNLDVICQSLDVADIVIPVKGLFAQTLPESKSAIGSIALLHADGDWYESTMDIFNNIYDRVVPNGFIQIDDYGHWDGCTKAIHEFERLCGQSFALRVIDYTGVWFQKEDSVHQDCNHWRTFWYLAQASEKMGNIELAKKTAQAVLKIVPKLVKAENLLNRYRSQLNLVVSPEVSLSAELDDFLNNLRLREINIILFPDWQQSEESLCLELEGVMTTLLAYKEPSKITALLDTSNISEEDANLVLSSVIMNILMQEDLDETDVPEVSLLGNLSEMQWKALLPCIHYRVVLENENEQAFVDVGAENIPVWKLNNFKVG
ncbi:TylF/MycF/NovP-related O-methyltransferase [Microcoleus sp. S13_B4]|uniref:TylF/MycF/NovP-related O-methyltransferase n=1 Tax=Microcoleus sp. S13_B4 TaxID=3055408 RepID=UPI002FCED6B3